ncbi:MAG: hypothetical protein VB934_22080 [Polyangiaceae bacterium]
MKMRYWIFSASLLTAAACVSEEPWQPVNRPGQNNPEPGGPVVGGHDDDDNPTNDNGKGNGLFAGGEDNTFSHMGDLSDGGGLDPFEILAQRQEEGPPEIRTRLHSCQKLQVRALRNILTTFGVDIDATGNPDTAGELFKNGRDALGGANYDSRSGESITWTNSGATKLHDIFAQAASEIIAKLPDAEHCAIDGEGVTMFDSDDRCNSDAITCLIGRPASEEHVAICTQLVQIASNTDKGKQIAVAAILSAAHSCE